MPNEGKSWGKVIVANPFVYSLSIAVYCTSWTFYGSVGEAATSGLSFLPIYLGPTLMASLWWLILYKIIGIAKEHRITTISDFIGSRYGNSLSLSALVTMVTLIGITPYLGLQMKAIMNTFTHPGRRDPGQCGRRLGHHPDPGHLRHHFRGPAGWMPRKGMGAWSLPLPLNPLSS